MSDRTGATVKSLRKQRGWTQRQLAERLGVQHAQVVSEMEAGRRSVKALELARLAQVFGVTPIALLGGQADNSRPRVLWRSAEGTPHEARAREEALFLKRCGQFAFLETLKGEVPAAAMPCFPLKPSAKYEEVEIWADQVRNMLNLGETPALGLQSALEGEWKLKIFFIPLEGGSAATARGDFGNGILLNSKEPIWRRNFSLAHELFHLLTWDAPVAAGGDSEGECGKRVETLAEIFASRMLIPSEEVTTLRNKIAHGKLTWFDLTGTARRLGVSTPALLWRLVNAGILPEETPRAFEKNPQLRALDREMRRRDTRPEPPFPQRYAFAAFESYLSGRISIGKLAEVMETTVGRLPKVLADYDLDLDAHAYQASALPA